MAGKVRFALDLGPLLAFFLAFRLSGLPMGTLTLIAATAISLGITYWLEKRVAILPLVSGIAITVLGGLTLLLHDDFYIKIKPTLVNLLFASVLLIGVGFKKPMLKYVLSEALHLTDEGWRKLSLRWGFFFMFLAALNEVMWRNFPTDVWVNFKVFGMFSLSMLFTLSQVPMMKKHWAEPES